MSTQRKEKDDPFRDHLLLFDHVGQVRQTRQSRTVGEGFGADALQFLRQSHGFKRIAVFKGAVADDFHRVRNHDFLQGDTVEERLFSDLFQFFRQGNLFKGDAPGEGKVVLLLHLPEGNRDP